MGLCERGEECGEDAGEVTVERLSRHAPQDGERLRVHRAGRQLRHQVGQHHPTHEESKHKLRERLKYEKKNMT